MSKVWFITGTSKGFGREWAIAQVSSIGGISAFPWVGIDHASKWALEGRLATWREWQLVAELAQGG